MQEYNTAKATFIFWENVPLSNAQIYNSFLERQGVYSWYNNYYMLEFPEKLLQRSKDYQNGSGSCPSMTAERKYMFKGPTDTLEAFDSLQ